MKRRAGVTPYEVFIEKLKARLRFYPDDHPMTVKAGVLRDAIAEVEMYRDALKPFAQLYERGLLHGPEFQKAYKVYHHGNKTDEPKP